LFSTGSLPLLACCMLCNATVAGAGSPEHRLSVPIAAIADSITADWSHCDSCSSVPTSRVADGVGWESTSLTLTNGSQVLRNVWSPSLEAAVLAASANATHGGSASAAVPLFVTQTDCCCAVLESSLWWRGAAPPVPPAPPAAVPIGRCRTVLSCANPSASSESMTATFSWAVDGALATCALLACACLAGLAFWRQRRKWRPLMRTRRDVVIEHGKTTPPKSAEHVELHTTAPAAPATPAFEN